MNEQVEERLKYFVNGERGPSNEDVMHEVVEQLELQHGKKVKRSRKNSTGSEEKPRKSKKVESEEDSEGNIEPKKGKKKGC